jgi:hypothetical protein
MMIIRILIKLLKRDVYNDSIEMPMINYTNIRAYNIYKHNICPHCIAIYSCHICRDSFKRKFIRMR